jgi:UDP-N-acetylglucosamine 2-epimerase (non-hydrolysing)
MTARILCIAGARPNFMKVGPLMRAIAGRPGLQPVLVHTGQHYDPNLSLVFFDELGIPRPAHYLKVGSGSHAVQTAEIMRRFELVLEQEQAQVTLVVGDVNSTVACAMVASKLPLRESFKVGGRLRRRPLVVHVEAGLRSFDDDMPEEINRKLTDAISDVLYVSEPAGAANLAREGVAPERIVFVGNVMIDSLLSVQRQAAGSNVLAGLGLSAGAYGVVTLHRPSNVDDADVLVGLMGALDSVARELPLVFPVHPRTRARLASAGFTPDANRWHLVEPVGYVDFVRLLSSAAVVLTDSGGIQEETTVLGVPCLTLRENTERPVTIDEGTNQLVGTDPERIAAAFARARSGGVAGRVPRLWDGRAAERIADHLAQLLATGE